MTPSPTDDPAIEYERRLRLRRTALGRLERIDYWLSLARGCIFLAGLAAAIAWYSSRAIPLTVAAAFFLAFVILVFAHGPLLDRMKCARLAVRYYERALARIADLWPGTGIRGDRYVRADHPYADDLDLFGRGSLFELICQARTRLGEDTLAAWLAAPATADSIRARQQSVEELRRDIDLRETLATLEAEVHDELDQNRLLQWSREAARPVGGRVRALAVVLALLTITGLLISAVTSVGISPVLFALLIEGVFLLSQGRNIRRLAQTADDAASGLAILAQVLAVLETRRFTSPLLTEITKRIESHGLAPSRQIARLQRLIGYLNNSLRNQFFVPIAFILALPIHLVHAIECWRADVGGQIPDWLGAVGEFESLVCLAGFAFEHPGDPFPEIVPDGPCLIASRIGHPLIPESRCVRNDLRLDAETRLVLISGSNMSGKSTMLRTVGTNVVLAQAGAPVRAARLTVSVLQIGTAMRIRDSLQDGESLFYAAASRLKAIVELAGKSPPLLFLFDEILQGTNSHDRLTGSEGILRALVERGAVGLITTHDLALTTIAVRIGPRAINVQFEDGMADGKMTFDYRIRPGVVHKSNALALMRMIGLEV